MSAAHIALILWRTPHQARRYLRHREIPKASWGDRIAAWRPVPQWARQHPLLERIMRLPVLQRYALVQLAYPHIEGPQKNPRLLLFALRACMPLVVAKHTMPFAPPLQCAQYQVLLASGQTQTMQVHLRQCARCQRDVRLFAYTRHAVIAAIAATQLPAFDVAPPPRVLGQVIIVLNLLLCFVVPLWGMSPVVNALTTASPQQLVRRAGARLYQPPVLADGMQWYQRYELFWYFRDGSVALLNGELWYSRSPAQYRVELTHYAGGSPYERDIATQAFRLYVIAAVYAPDVWPPSTQSMRVIMPMASQLPQQALEWRLRQGAWGMPAAVLRHMHDDDSLMLIGNTVADDGTALLRVQTDTWWADIDPQQGQLYALWQRHTDAPQMRWRMRWHEISAVSDSRTFVITQPQNGAVESRSRPAIHPALPQIADQTPAVRAADTVQFETASQRCEATLSDVYVAHCRDMLSGVDTVYTVGGIP
ncbi:MAG: hypothetical protein ACK5C8_09630 [Roseiflexaceae bacterium]|jgi:hypothetical protein|nr:hypothetical protein [Chloroflexaceae bacterium]MCE2852370.1 hypothetical protein [Chloroflexaceae bacterium]